MATANRGRYLPTRRNAVNPMELQPPHRPIWLLTGMNRDTRIFSRILPALPSARVVAWIAPHPRETLLAYARRLAATLPHDEPAVVCGVSFGGLVARELAWQLRAHCCIQISSVCAPGEMPPWFRILRPWGCGEPFLKLLGATAQQSPRPLRGRMTMRLERLAGPDGDWFRWAAGAVLRWRPGPELAAIPLVRVHGDRDTVFPIRYLRPDIIIPRGGHVLPLSHSAEILDILMRYAHRQPPGCPPAAR